MNREEAKLILQVCRPGDEAAADAQVAAALALAKADPVLAAWHAEEQRWDESIRSKLEMVPVPADLRARILAGEPAVEEVADNVVELPMEDQEVRFIPLRFPRFLAIAAVLIITFSLAFNWIRRPQPAGQLADFARDMMVASSNGAHHVDVENSNINDVRGWLAGHHALADIDLPPAIKSAPGLMGCRALGWHGRQVSMLCFMMKGSEHVDLFVTPAGSISDAPEPGQPRFAMVNQQMTAGWTAAGNVYLMTGRVPEEFLRHCLDPAATVQAFLPVWLGTVFQPIIL
jgi:hypothetical protein